MVYWNILMLIMLYSVAVLPGVSDYAEIVEEEDDYSTPDGKIHSIFLSPYTLLFHLHFIFI